MNFSSSCVRMEEHGMQKPLGLRVETEGYNTVRVETEGYNTVDSQIIKSSDQWLRIHVCRLWKPHQLEDSRSHVAEGAVLHALYFVTGIDNNELNRIE